MKFILKIALILWPVALFANDGAVPTKHRMECAKGYSYTAASLPIGIGTESEHSKIQINDQVRVRTYESGNAAIKETVFISVRSNNSAYYSSYYKHPKYSQEVCVLVSRLNV